MSPILPVFCRERGGMTIVQVERRAWSLILASFGGGWSGPKREGTQARWGNSRGRIETQTSRLPREGVPTSGFWWKYRSFHSDLGSE